MQELVVYNTLSRQKEKFEPLTPPFVGMYVCGPTVYGEAHLGHARPAITFDIVFRYLKQLKYNVRYIRNITDVGHLENDADEGEDKIAKKARIEQLEPMEIVQYYTDSYHKNMEQLNVLKPSIEPRASGHIIEQQEMIARILKNGWAYKKNGSVYFDVEKYNKEYQYGKLSGRILDDLMTNTRQLDGQDEKKNPFDFALWKKASPEHIMRWSSEWSAGFPGWHLECSTMGAKYLGETFDIHGGGMDLLFPHHECEIAQSVAANGKEPVRYWLHNNMITINGKKMGKSLGNFITLNELFSGKHNLLEQAYSPMTIRFFILQAHYRSTLDFSNEALQAAEKGLKRLLAGFDVLTKIKASKTTEIQFDIEELEKKCYQALNDDFNTPILIAHLFEGMKTINSIYNNQVSVNESFILKLKDIYQRFMFDILGLVPEQKEKTGNRTELVENLIDMMLEIRLDAKKQKDFSTADKIRNQLTEMGIIIKDKKDGFEWELAD